MEGRRHRKGKRQSGGCDWGAENNIKEKSPKKWEIETQPPKEKESRRQQQMMPSVVWAVRPAGGCCCCCCLLSAAAVSRGGDVSKVNRKGSFSFPMMGKRLKFVKTAAAAMIQEPPQRQSENLGELLSSEELNNQTKGKGGSEQHHGEACLEFTQLSRLHLRHGMPFFFFWEGGATEKLRLMYIQTWATCRKWTTARGKGVKTADECCSLLFVTSLPFTTPVYLSSCDIYLGFACSSFLRGITDVFKYTV